nr:uncharacterized protein LOC132768763 [Anolis sagrei ordinatus]
MANNHIPTNKNTDGVLTTNDPSSITDPTTPPSIGEEDRTHRLYLQEDLLYLPGDLGLIVNQEKSHLLPSQRIQFIGAVLDSTLRKAYLPEDRLNNLRQAILDLQNRKCASAWAIQSILGHMSSTTTVTPFARLRLRPLQNWFLRVFRPHKDSQNTILHPPQLVLDSLSWWTKRYNVNRGMPFHPPRPSMALTTDASTSGWGAHINDLQISGRWSKPERQLHINALELIAVEKALRAFKPIVYNHTIQVVTDNTTIKYYLNKQGGTHSQTLLSIATRIWEWCIEERVFLIAIHLPGQDNTLADSLSRSTQTNHEWQLHPSKFKVISNLWGMPQIDLFASPTNTHCPLFCARLPPRAFPGCLGDAFLFQWNPGLLYLFPPLPLLSSVIAKIITDNTNCILIAPWWPRQPWFTPLLQLSQGQFLRLHLSPDLLTVENGLIQHPDPHSLHLTAWRIKPR